MAWRILSYGNSIACMKCADNQDKKCILTTNPINECIAKIDEADGIPGFKLLEYRNGSGRR